MTEIWRFANGGASLGPLPYDSAVHEEDLDGTDKLTVVTRHDPQKRDRLVWQDASGAWHEHMVDSTRRTHGSAKPRTEATCSNSVSELFGVYATGTLLKSSVQGILSTLLNGTRWTAGTCDDFGVVELEVWHKSVRECMSELCELVGGELETAISVDSDGVSSRTASIVRERGSKSVAREFSWGANASGIKREVGADEVYTAIVGYGANVDATDTSDYSARITVTVESELDLSQWGVPNGDGTFSHNYTTYTDNACTDTVFLSKQCSSILDSVSTPLIRYEFDAAQVDEAMWADVRLGNLVLCTDHGFDPELRLRERVSHIRREFSGRVSARVAIGSRTNPLVERFKAGEMIARRTTGNGTRTARSGYTRGNYGDKYQAQTAPTQPHHIKVAVLPTKSEYMKGETLDFTGIVVKLYDASDNLFTSTWYPDGIAPLNELSFDPTKAPNEVKTAGKYDEELPDGGFRIYGLAKNGDIYDESRAITSIDGKPTIFQYVCNSEKIKFRPVVYVERSGVKQWYSPWATALDVNLYDVDSFVFTAGSGTLIYRYDSDDFDDPNTDPYMTKAVASMEYGLVHVTVQHNPTFLSTIFDMKVDASWSGSGGGDF